MSSDKDSLLEMGFTAKQVDKALAATANAGLTQALDYLDKHADESQEFWDTPAEEAAANTADNEAPAEAKSLKCLDCGKMFRNTALANYHGEKSGHENFEESTEEIAPLTEEEKKAKLEELKAKMSEKKKLAAKREAEEAKANEAIRRKGGKDQAEIKAQLALKEAEKEAAQRKKDKLEDAKARAAVRAQIEADKKARAEKAAREKALRDGTALPEAEESSAPTFKPPAATAAASTRNYDQTRLQIRVPNGAQPLVHSVASTATLADVKSWVSEQTGLGQITFSSAFPRKTYSPAEEGQTMTELGLAPSAVLMVQ